MIDVPLTRRLVLALDTADADVAVDLLRRTRGVVGTAKVGLELFTALGPSFFSRLRRDDVEIFLDLKLHDIPNTVAAAVREAALHHVSLLTVHASGGAAMLAAAHLALQSQTAVPGGPFTRLLAVTVLTHMTAADVASVGYQGDPAEVALRLAKLAQEAGLYGCVCSPQEASTLRKAMGPDFALLCPGIRDKNAARDDQSRTATAREAVAWGADYIVVGRPIRNAADPAAVAARLLEDIELGLAERT